MTAMSRMQCGERVEVCVTFEHVLPHYVSVLIHGLVHVLIKQIQRCRHVNWCHNFAIPVSMFICELKMSEIETRFR